MIDLSNLALVDTETTGLDPAVHRVWELAIGRYDDDGLTVETCQLEVPDDVVAVAEPEALEVSGFRDRYDPAVALHRSDFAAWVGSRLEGRVLVGKNPAFDDGMLRATLGYVGPVPWHYRTLCVDQIAFGALCAYGVAPRVPWRSNELAELLGVEIPDGRHTAEGDVRLVAAMLEAVVGLTGTPRQRFKLVDRDGGRHDVEAWGGSDLLMFSNQGYEDAAEAEKRAVARAQVGDELDGEVLTFARLAELRRRHFGGRR